MLKIKYNPPYPLTKGHFNTIWANLSGRSLKVPYKRWRIDTPDGDFLDIDTLASGKSEKLLITGHGLEGSASSSYMKRFVSELAVERFDIWAINWRSCSGEPNRKLISYHSGFTSDLAFVIEQAFEHGYRSVFLAGFSLGGNILLKYLGEQGDRVDQRIKAAIAVSVPVDLTSVAARLDKPSNRIYLNRFLRSLKAKARIKKEMFPDAPFSLDDVLQTTSFAGFDNLYTAPVNGYRNALEYWTQNSSLPYLGRISVPALLLNAQDDPFLTGKCFPKGTAPGSAIGFYHHYPSYGGHAGFIHRLLPSSRSYAADTAKTFFKEIMP